MIICKTMAGAILGPGGQRMNRIRAESQAVIDMGGVNDNYERVITITGAPEVVRKARRLLEQAIRENLGRCYKCDQVSHLARE